MCSNDQVDERYCEHFREYNACMRTQTEVSNLKNRYRTLRNHNCCENARGIIRRQYYAQYLFTCSTVRNIFKICKLIMYIMMRLRVIVRNVVRARHSFYIRTVR